MPANFRWYNLSVLHYHIPPSWGITCVCCTITSPLRYNLSICVRDYLTSLYTCTFTILKPRNILYAMHFYFTGAATSSVDIGAVIAGTILGTIALTALVILLLGCFIYNKKRKSKKLRIRYWLIQYASWKMMLSFWIHHCSRWSSRRTPASKLHTEWMHVKSCSLFSVLIMNKWAIHMMEMKKWRCSSLTNMGITSVICCVACMMSLLLQYA